MEGYLKYLTINLFKILSLKIFLFKVISRLFANFDNLPKKSNPGFSLMLLFK